MPGDPEAGRRADRGRSLPGDYLSGQRPAQPGARRQALLSPRLPRSGGHHQSRRGRGRPGAAQGCDYQAIQI